MGRLGCVWGSCPDLRGCPGDSLVCCVILVELVTQGVGGDAELGNDSHTVLHKAFVLFIKT